MPNGDAEFFKAVDRVLAAVASRVETFPWTLDEAYGNKCGDSILAGCAIEIAEGNEPGAETPSDTDIASHGIWLMQRVRDDIDDIIAALRAYQPADG
ncbi:MAG TPA: hypothetical protein DGT21_24490 [Armatimonadetes bacterium]|jgi:hypothetical protein|nr:hypothetical protein [Armatimonadota bacterium]